MSPEELLVAAPLGLAGSRRRLVMMGERPIANVRGPTDRLSVLVSRAGDRDQVSSVLGALIGPRPTALFALRGTDGRTTAGYLHRGTLVGALTTADLGVLGPWTLEFQRVYGPPSLGAEVDLARMFLEEQLLEALDRVRDVGSCLTFLQGDLDWLGHVQPRERGVTIEHLLLEHARRNDELPRIESALRSTAQVPVPLGEPGERPGRPFVRGPDFFDDPDQAAAAEWVDARRVFRLCDGAATIEGLVERSMLGRFRTLSAILALAQRRHVQLVDAEGMSVRSSFARVS